MGFFSWKCSKTHQSIPAYPHANKPIEMSKVVVVLPDNRKLTGVYDGYGNVDGIDIHDELAKCMFPDRINPTREDIFSNKKYAEKDGTKITFEMFNWDTPVSKLDGLTMNKATQAGWKITSNFDIASKMIKIVRADAYNGETYDQLKTSEDCPDQGFFYDDEEEVSVHDEDVEE